jgi:Fe-Mn family superoxide dismutase
MNPAQTPASRIPSPTGLSRRGFLLSIAGATAAATTTPALLERADAAVQSGAYELPPLPYDYGALEPHIDAQTMRLHHDRHHAAYVRNLNEALAKHPALKARPPEDLIRNLAGLPEDIRTTVRNNGGGHVNHTLFWKIMKPGGGGPPTGPLAAAINSQFDSFDNFRRRFNEAGERQFGSGWVWLVRDRGGRLRIVTTPNQDSPWTSGQYPVLGNDVWEHAYYLKYQNRRADYLKAWWNVVNWAVVNTRFQSAPRELR